MIRILTIITAVAVFVGIAARAYHRNQSASIPTWVETAFVATACLFMDGFFVILMRGCWTEAAGAGASYHGVLDTCLKFSSMFIVLIVVVFSAITATLGLLWFRCSAWSYVLGGNAVLVFGSLYIIWQVTR